MKRVEGANSNIAIEVRVLAGGLPSARVFENQQRATNSYGRAVGENHGKELRRVFGRKVRRAMMEFFDRVIKHSNNMHNKVTTVSRRGTVGRSRLERHARDDDVR
jgi:hypothetical protein